MQENKPDTLFDTWLALPEAQCKPMDAGFRDIFELSCEEGILDNNRGPPVVAGNPAGPDNIY